MKTIIRSLLLIFLLGAASSYAKPLTDKDIPDPLKPWVNWVMYNQDQYSCPSAYNNNQQHFCAWPASLKLDLEPTEGEFEQQWQVHNEAWIRLPGSNKHWPQSVTVDNEPAVVLSKDGFPGVQLSAGAHTLRGKFSWDSLPETMTIPPSTGLINITRNGKALPFPRINRQGQLWLDKSQQQKNVENSVDVQVFRKIYDGHPMRVETRIVLNISGNSRDIVFPKAQLSGFTPIELQSKLPTRINQQGDLHVQVRPGNWDIRLYAYSANNVTTLSMPKVSHENWPRQEVWVFEADPSMRLVDIEGVSAVDSRQTRLPSEWHSYPAYLLEAEQTMNLKTLQRGSAKPEPNRLSLERTLWMDFSGKGYTLHDQIRGTMTRGWRLSAAPALDLGRVSVDDEPQFITRLDNDKSKGVEVRRGSINLTADSRYKESIATVPVTGWQHDFQRVDTQLYLPPGWKLFSAHGSDNLPDTWLQRWTLLDLFMVLVITVAISRLWDWKWGGIALLTLTLIWHEPNAPRYIWLNLIAAIALLRVLPDGLAKKVLWSYRNLSFLALLLIIIPFIITEVRHGLYPQLGLYTNYEAVNVNQSQIMSFDSAEMAAPTMAPSPEYMEDRSASGVISKSIRSAAPYSMARKDKGTMVRQSKNVLNEVDPNANIQTGPGLPTWDWQPVHFVWNSPVDPSQTLKLNFISPTMNMILNFLRVAFLLLLISRLVKAFTSPSSKDDKGNSSGSSGKKWYQRFIKSTAAIVLIPALLMGVAPQRAQAEEIAPVPAPSTPQNDSASTGMPNAEMLNALKERLLAADDCLPECALIENMQLQVSEQGLIIHLKVHSANNSVIPLPASGEQWRADSVLLDHAAATALSRDNAGTLWLGMGKGTHIVTLQGRLPQQPQLSISLPLKPRYVSWQGSGWTVEGIRENNMPEQQLQLVRTQAKDAAANSSNDSMQENTVLPPLLHIERTLHLGLDWNIDTQITRLSPVGSPVNMRIPLLANEYVLSNANTVRNGKIAISLGSMDKGLSWKSRIPVAEALKLTAIKQAGVVESWKLDISPIWHANITGIPEIHHETQNAEWLPEWKPWPAESIELAISRPAGVDGRTMTIERSVLNTTVGKRTRESVLSLRLRSSRGGQHVVTLPEGAELLSVSIDNKLQPVRQKERLVSLPISPGQQSIDLNWRETKDISSSLVMPAVDLGIDSVNNSIRLDMGRDRWILLTGGPQMGPAVLFWGVLLVILLGSIVLGKIKDSPLKIWQWFLLGVGLSLVTPFMLLVVIGWLMALKYRPLLQQVTNNTIFNMAQVLLVLLTLISFGVLFFALQQGLLGWPDMQIAGNGSSAWRLQWFQDRTPSLLPQPWVISVPLLAYRLLMLLWALWLAFALISWLKWGWNNFTVGGLWRKKDKKEDAKASA